MHVLHAGSKSMCPCRKWCEGYDGAAVDDRRLPARLRDTEQSVRGQRVNDSLIRPDFTHVEARHLLDRDATAIRFHRERILVQHGFVLQLSFVPLDDVDLCSHQRVFRSMIGQSSL